MNDYEEVARQLGQALSTPLPPEKIDEDMLLDVLVALTSTDLLWDLQVSGGSAVFAAATELILSSGLTPEEREDYELLLVAFAPGRGDGQIGYWGCERLRQIIGEG